MLCCLGHWDSFTLIRQEIFCVNNVLFSSHSIVKLKNLPASGELTATTFIISIVPLVAWADRAFSKFLSSSKSQKTFTVIVNFRRFFNCSILPFNKKARVVQLESSCMITVMENLWMAPCHYCAVYCSRY